MQGYALNDQEVELGLRSLAVPIANAHGKVVAGLNVGVSASIPPEHLMRHFLPPLLRLQSQLRGVLR